MADTHISASLIKAVSGEFDLQSVKRLMLCNMNIRRMEQLEDCSNITEIDLSDNRIIKIEGLQGSSKLRKLSLAGNQISTIEGLGHLNTLESLQIQGNQISSLSELEKLAPMQSLRTLFLKNIDGSQRNPVCDHPSYRSVILRHLPQLTNLDGERLKNAHSAVEGPSGNMGKPNFPVPESKPWLEGFAWDDCYEDIETVLKRHDTEFSKLMTESKKLSANAASLLSHYQE